MSNFIDETNICIRAGDGGSGCVSFRREAHVPYGGPDGGDGGSGGSVWLEADKSIVSLISFKDHPHRIADGGVNGGSSKKHGKSASDLIVKVPIGTIVKNHDSGEMIIDLVNHGDRWLAAPGGEGGKGNAKFFSRKRRVPGFAELGESCEETWYRLELKLLADVALVGFPSAGKSTLISSISSAKPKIADYPFTTLEPNLGVVKLSDDAEFIMADIPGLIEGAHDGKGMGIQFLRHIERSRVLVYLLDLAAVDSFSPKDQYEILKSELGNYQPHLLDKPSLVVGSKADVLTSKDWGDQVPDEMKYEISSVTGKGLKELSWDLNKLVSADKESSPISHGYVVHKPKPEGVQVVRDIDGSWRVLGRSALRAVAVTNVSDYSALEYVQDRLKKIGVDKALKSAGVKEGEEVHIGDFTFEYHIDL